ncbi:MAG: glycosyltransferase [Promethearchaeota archaeon]
MIFVTVGSARFDPLIQRMDELVGEGALADSVIAQIGRGSYVPVNIRYFRFLKSLVPAYDVAEVIVSTGGVGTTIECIKRGLRFVVVENTTLMEGHQVELIREIARRGHLVWCQDLDNLPHCIEEAKTREFRPYKPDTPRVHLVIQDLLDNT